MILIAAGQRPQDTRAWDMLVRWSAVDLGLAYWSRTCILGRPVGLTPLHNIFNPGQVSRLRAGTLNADRKRTEQIRAG